MISYQGLVRTFPSLGNDTKCFSWSSLTLWHGTLKESLRPFFLNRGYCDFPEKKFLKALSRSLNDCCKHCDGAIFSHARHSSFFQLTSSDAS